MSVSSPAPVHVLSGASSDIGAAIARKLAGSGRAVLALGRNRERLHELERSHPGRVAARVLDLTNEDSLQALAHELAAVGPGIAALIHCAGVYFTGGVESGPPDELDRMYQVNVRAPYRLTQLLLPGLARSAGRVLFINSTAALRAPAGLGGYCASRHSLRALADSLRDEVNARGILVTSIYLGRTATRHMAGIFQAERRPYRPELLLQPDDVADSVLYVLGLPPRAEVMDLTIRPALKSY